MICFALLSMNPFLAERGSLTYSVPGSCSYFSRKSSPEFFSRSTRFHLLTTHIRRSLILRKRSPPDRFFAVCTHTARAPWSSSYFCTSHKPIFTVRTKDGGRSFGSPDACSSRSFSGWLSRVICFHGTREPTLRLRWEPTRPAKFR